MSADLQSLAGSLATILAGLAADHPPIPGALPSLPALPREGRGISSLPELWRLVADGSAKLGSGLMMGHMDTSPHPVAVMSDALVAALNNNLLFRELSPIASRIEEAVIGHFIEQFGLTGSWGGTCVSGGSIANLTALFAACGGFSEVEERNAVRLFVPAHAHASIRKAASILGIAPSQVLGIPGDEVGHPYPAALEDLLTRTPAQRRIVVAAVGSTIHGAVDPLAAIAKVARRHGAWLHVDAIHGGAVVYSALHRHLLTGIAEADSIVMGPQKWLYVPRLSAILLLRDRERFNTLLGVELPYSATGEEHRGKWGMQGSRRADAVTLWLLLQTLGTAEMGRLVDASIARTRQLHTALSADDLLEPTHAPELNLQCFRPRARQDDAGMIAAHRRLTENQGAWVSLTRWKGALQFRAVLLSSRTTSAHLNRLIADVRAALAG